MNQQDKLRNRHFHHEDKQCKLIPKVKVKLQGIGKKKQRHLIRGQKCLTHNKFVCRCGWEFTWHNGIDKKIPPYKKEKFED